MTARIAPAPEVLLCHGPHAVTLRASLRVAVALDAWPGGIPAVWEDTARQKLTTLHAVIRASATDQAGAERLLADTATRPLARFTHRAQAACLALLSVILEPAQGEADCPGMTPARPLRAHLADLYRYGTGWLGWSPSEVWNASVAELEVATLALIDRLVLLTPSAVPAEAGRRPGAYTPEQLKQIADQGFDPAFDRVGLQRLKALI